MKKAKQTKILLWVPKINVVRKEHSPGDKVVETMDDPPTLNMKVSL